MRPNWNHSERRKIGLFTGDTNRHRCRRSASLKPLTPRSRQSMELDPHVFVLGIGADKRSAIFGSTAGLVEQFGAKRVFDTPISEQGLTALAIGAAQSGHASRARPSNASTSCCILWISW